MTKINGFQEAAQLIAYEEILRTHEKKAKKAIINEKVKELVAEGVDKEIAKVMAKSFWDCGLFR